MTSGLTQLRIHKLTERAPRMERTYGTTGILNPKTPASLGCRASGDPAPSITWTLDGAWPIIGGGPRLRLWSTIDSATGDAVSFLNWTSVETSDSGHYQCLASNVAGRAEHVFRMDVRGPLFMRPAYNATALEGHSLALQCPFGGYPYDKISWFKELLSLSVAMSQKKKLAKIVHTVSTFREKRFASVSFLVVRTQLVRRSRRFVGWTTCRKECALVSAASCTPRKPSSSSGLRTAHRSCNPFARTGSCPRSRWSPCRHRTMATTPVAPPTPGQWPRTVPCSGSKVAYFYSVY
ncbi:hypothetical protein HPB51_026415 [Rhipicephalus microplus]|uniref:Ig-like domain-containing protein n=1 Tax=Rhipicephalus microplus TaxID=6941 RepID=A0A9J6D339_RHIMP|nr:hypothetical protein HPB51_026415 [Rhipicephalus microplus]